MWKSGRPPGGGARRSAAAGSWCRPSACESREGTPCRAPHRWEAGGCSWPSPSSAPRRQALLVLLYVLWRGQRDVRLAGDAHDADPGVAQDHFVERRADVELPIDVGVLADHFAGGANEIAAAAEP